jgi:N-acetylglucosamine-6-phosphate deacetylase
LLWYSCRVMTPSGRVTCAGFCDLQVNGFAGVDFNDPGLNSSQVQQAAAAMQATGVTLFLATLISGSRERFAACARAVLHAGVPALAGLHMEGPYISPNDGPRGAHVRSDVTDASVEDFKRRQDLAEGQIQIVTLAPEVPGALDLIEYLVKTGVRVSIGHTAASGDQLAEAAKRGATLSTHLGNGCAQMLPRHPNVIWEQLALDNLMASFIVDGHHLPPATVKAMIRAKSPSMSVLVTDATSAAGLPPGEYTLGSLRVRLDENGRVAVPGEQNLAGSALTLDRAVGNTVRYTGLPLSEVLSMASTQPAAYLGRAPRGGLDGEWDGSGSRFTVRRVLV